MDKKSGLDWLKRISRWYFGRNALLYSVVLADTVIVFLSSAFVYWAFHRTGSMFEHRFAMLYPAIMLSLLSWVGSRVFRTYSGVFIRVL